MKSPLAPAAPLLFALASLLACGVPPNPEEDADVTDATGVDAAAEPAVPAATAGDPTPASAAAEPLVIAPEAFDGVVIGVPLAEVADRLTLEARGAAGGLDAYGITDEAGMRTGTVYVDDAEEVARIVVTNTEAETVDKLGVGSTYGDLRRVHPGAEVTGAEGDDRVTVSAGGLSWVFAASGGQVNDGTEVVEVVVE